MAGVGNQYAQISTCMANVYCKIQRYEAIGRDISCLSDTLKKLWVCYALYDISGYDCEVACFLNANCGC
jgi:hypothetical protein